MLENVIILRNAAEKIREYEIPHIIHEDEWVARWNISKKTIGVTERTYNAPQNLRFAWEEILGKSIFAQTKKKDNPKFSFKLFFHRIKMASSYLKMSNFGSPDAEVNGNLVHWVEHAGHIALWSPSVAKSLAKFFDAEADAVESGFFTSSTEYAVTLAQQIVEKTVWADSEEPRRKVVEPFWFLICRESKKGRARYRSRRSFLPKNRNSEHRYYMNRYGYLPSYYALKYALEELKHAKKSSLRDAAIKDFIKAVMQESEHKRQ